MDGQIKKSFVLVFCVFLFYQDICVTAFFIPKIKIPKLPKFVEKIGKDISKTIRKTREKVSSIAKVIPKLSFDVRNTVPNLITAAFSIPAELTLPWKGKLNLKKAFSIPAELTLPWKGKLNLKKAPKILSDGQFLQILNSNEKSAFNKFISQIEGGASRAAKTLRMGTLGNAVRAAKTFQQALVENEKMNNKEFINQMKTEGFNVTNEKEICADWQDYDGSTCVCSDQCSGSSDINKGTVCTSDGKRYQNRCEYTFKMCSGQTNTSVTLASCGTCNTMKLTGGSKYPEDRARGLGIFRKDTNTNTWTAVDDHGTQLKLFYSKESKTWVIGSPDLKNAGIIFKTYIPNPQDSSEGAVIYVNDTYGELDPFLHFECISDSSEVAKRDTQAVLSRRKRFIFLIVMAAIGIAATVAQITITAIQHKRGCLFYQDVCRMKKEIKDRLQPEVESLKRTFNSIIGNPVGFRDSVHEVFNQLLTIKEKMVELRKLENEFRDLSKTIGPELKYLSPVISADFSTSFHDEWLKALGKQTTWSIIGLMYVQMPIEIVSLLVSTAGKAAMAFAAIGAVISVALAVVGIVVSWKNEKKQRDQLRKVKRNLIDAKQRLKSAISHAKAFQIKFYNTVIYPMKKFTQHMRNYDRHFQNFYNFLRSSFGSSMNENAGSWYYGKVTSRTINTVKDRHLSPLISFLSFKLNDLKEKIKAYRDMEKILTLVKTNVAEERYPGDIMMLAVAVHRDISTKLIPSEFALLKFIADKVAKNKNCYWGYDLDGIRKGTIIHSNYRSVPLCNSPELSGIEGTFVSLTNQNMSPERIVARIQHKRFYSNYQKLKYLSDIMLPAKDCYWGYPLALIRKNKLSRSEVENAKLSKPLFMSLKLVPDNFQATTMCSTVKICNSNWQAYVKCLLKAFDGRNMCKGADSCSTLAPL